MRYTLPLLALLLVGCDVVCECRDTSLSPVSPTPPIGMVLPKPTVRPPGELPSVPDPCAVRVAVLELSANLTGGQDVLLRWRPVPSVAVWRVDVVRQEGGPAVGWRTNGVLDSDGYLRSTWARPVDGVWRVTVTPETDCGPGTAASVSLVLDRSAPREDSAPSVAGGSGGSGGSGNNGNGQGNGGNGTGNAGRGGGRGNGWVWH